MSRFSTEVRVNASKSDILRIGQSILEEMGLLFQDRDFSNLLFKEKYRFDPFNPVEMRLQVRENGDGSLIKLEGENLGEGPYQETHVKRLVFELMDRLDECVGIGEGEDRPNDPDIVRELELLTSLHNKGILTDHEFQKAKEKLLH
jgi:hypothetical protein